MSLKIDLLPASAPERHREEALALLDGIEDAAADSLRTYRIGAAD